jgi:hypothetical protein
VCVYISVGVRIPRPHCCLVELGPTHHRLYSYCLTMPELKPDILRLIIDHAVGDLATKNPKEKARQQEQLFNLMQVSQVSESLGSRCVLRNVSLADGCCRCQESEIEQLRRGVKCTVGIRSSRC